MLMDRAACRSIGAARPQEIAYVPNDCGAKAIVPRADLLPEVCARDAIGMKLFPKALVDAAEVAAFLRERLADFKAPRMIESETALPRGFGKIIKRKLREPHWAQAGGIFRAA
jgi:hypothetical protein